MKTIYDKSAFESACNKITRDGATDFLNWLKTTDFFEAPASTKFHSNFTGGLCNHSVLVYKRMCEQNELLGFDYSDETLAIVSLFHDVCKANFYTISYRNAKNEFGVWEKVPYFSVDEKFKCGYHGPKSAFLIMQYMKLSEEEFTAISCHMGAYDRPNGDYSISSVFAENPLALMLSVADQYATNLDEEIK